MTYWSQAGQIIMTARIVANRYQMGQKIGSGGMGDVFQGIDQRTDSPVAIKVLKPELATSEMITRFIREGEALRRLNHPNIVALLDAVHEDDQNYLIMELVTGGALDEILSKTPRLPISQVLNIALDLADALTRAHRLNIIHRDIKPANVLMAEDGMPRLTDFGIARVMGSNITETGSIMGTAAYIAPEVLQGSPADARADIWSLGVMFFEMLTGRRPFTAEHAGSLIYAIIAEPLPDLEELRPDAPPALVDLVQRMLSKDPASRIPRMRLVGAELEAILSGEIVGISDDDLRFGLTDSDGFASRFVTPSPSPKKTGKTIDHNLPVQVTPFVGRDEELNELEKLLRDSSVRLLTILAPGGMGKTRLALELAGRRVHGRASTTSTITETHAFENGIYFVDLAPLPSPDHILQAIAEAVGYPFQQDGRDSQQQIIDFLREKNLLLLMDNFEHVVEGRVLVQEILSAAPLVRILVTSREKLNLSAETVFILSGLDFPQWETPEDALEYGAVKLFMQSANRVRPDFRLQADDLNYVARICRMVQGTPLGILLAAGWLEALSPAEITDEISRSLDFLETEMHDLPERQRSLRAVFEYSWNLLTDEERGLFARFSIFRGGFTREAAQRITNTSLRTLTVMVNKSLLRRDTISGRYEIHELLRQYAEEKLKAAGESAIQAIYETLSAYYADLLTQLTPRLKGHGQLEALTAIETDFENIRTAWDVMVKSGNAERVQGCMEGLYLYLTFRSRMMDGEEMFGLVRRRWPAQGDNPPLVAGQALVRFLESPSLAQFRLGLSIAEKHGDPYEIAFCQRLVGHWLSHTDFNQEEGIPMLRLSLDSYEKLGDKFYMARVLDDLGWSYNLNMTNDQQLPVVTHSIELRREIGDKIGTANALRNLGGASGGFFDPRGKALEYWEEAKQIAYEMHDRLEVAWNAGLQGINHVFRGEFDIAQTRLEEAYPHARDINDPIVKGFILIMRGATLALREENYSAALKLMREGYPADAPSDFRLMAAPLAACIIACGLDDLSVLKPHLDRYIMEGRFNVLDLYLPMFVPYRLVQLTKARQYVRAAEILGAFMEYPYSFGGVSYTMRWVESWPLFVRMRDEIKGALGEAEFQAAWERGRGLSAEDLDAELRSLLDTSP